MTAKHLDGSKLSIHLTSTGYVALEYGQLSTDAELALFGPKGDVPPTSIPSLTTRLLQTINAAPDSTDAADLKLFARDLKASLAQVETTLARLDKSGDKAVFSLLSGLGMNLTTRAAALAGGQVALSR